MNNNKQSKIRDFFSTVFYVLKESMVISIRKKYRNDRKKMYEVATVWFIGAIIIMFYVSKLPKGSFLERNLFDLYTVIGAVCVLIFQTKVILKLRNVNLREPSELELKLLKLLMDKANVDLYYYKNKILVQDMNDGGMGSLTLYPDGIYIDKKKRKFGKCVSDHEYLDVDGVHVLASLYIDDSGKLYEIDSWKVDFTPLVKINI